MALKNVLKKCFISTLVITQVFALIPMPIVGSPLKPEKVFGESKLDMNQYGKKMYHFTDEEDLKYKIFSDASFIKSYATLADKLGFAWCGGTASKFVGEDFSVSKSGKDYIIKANYNANDPYASGYWADKRLTMKVSNVRFYMAPETLKTGAGKITNTKELLAGECNLENHSPTATDKVSTAAAYQLMTTGSYASTYKFSEGLGLKQSFKASVVLPFVGSVESTTEFNFNFTTEQGWTDTTTKATSTTLTNTYTGDIPPNSKRHLQLIAVSNTSEVPYTADIFVEYTITFSGFLQYTENAHVNHPTDRPWKDFTFGVVDNNRMVKSAAEDIADQFSHKDIPGYSEWDWNQVAKNEGSMPWFIKNCAMVRGGNFSGVFKFENASTMKIKAGAPEPLDSTTSVSEAPQSPKGLRIKRSTEKISKENISKSNAPISKGNVIISDFVNHKVPNVNIIDIKLTGTSGSH